ncbi:M24 family metallopeptidase [Corynebacterium aquilae]|uniref:Peptidase M24 n=1 Tax=Corynebacterium aquilae DSM 44791 TaxID=1431546 RepID=A0A1L7CFZ5_9CORY|nr:M24 family metallopeptidase [Corynebacterium aquilae]APT84745.1 peptidase M24 [Corynebacterium aquilae DSM 44791]
MSETFATDVYVARMRQAEKLCAELGTGGLVVPTGMLMKYFTGLEIDSHERLTALVLGGEPTLISPAVDVPTIDPGLGLTQKAWPDGSSPYALVAEALSGAESDGPIVVGSALTADHVLRLQKVVGTDMLLAEEALGELLACKDEAEIAALAEAGEAIDAVHAQVPELLRAGRTEREVAADLERLILERHTSVDFIIVGSGPNGALPHHDYSDRVLAAGEMVVVDIGGTMPSGYCSDCTRTYVVPGGELDERLAAAYDVLSQAQRAALAQARPGVTAGSVDAAARDIITEAGYGEFFFHRTGHGIGLSTHEEPAIAAGNDRVLEPGMAFSIEPGIYISELGGARIEDIVVVTEDGVRRLNSRPRTLDASPEDAS